jgi:aminotransferase EvaB
MTEPGKVPMNDLRRAVVGERAALLESWGSVLDGGYFVLGSQHDSFERELAEYTGVPHAIGLANGTDALAIGLSSLGVGPGDVVVTVANAGGYATTAILMVGASPRYVDIDDATLSMDPDQLTAALATGSVAAVVLTHLYGNAAPVLEIAEACRTAGVALLEDCAQAAGLRVDGRHVGSFGDAGAFSFYPTKNLAALGDGGALITRDGTVADRARSLRQYGWDAKYQVALPHGRNSRLDEVQAAVLRHRLPAVDANNHRRRAILGRYAEALPRSVGRFVVGEHRVAHLAVAVLDDRSRVKDALSARVATDVHYPVPDHRQVGWAGAAATVELPVTEQMCERVLTLPCFPEMTDSEIDQVCEALRDLR